MKYPHEEFKEIVCEYLAYAIKDAYSITITKREIEEKLEKPTRTPIKGMEKGLTQTPDLAYPCFFISKKMKEFQITPPEIANKIVEIIREKLKKKGKEKYKLLDRIEGIESYVNFYINVDLLAEKVVDQIFDMGSNFGKQLKKNKKIIVEHTSANPNGPLHVGRARNPIIGDTMARILRFGGYDVTTQYYVDNMGKQVAILFWGVKNLDIKTKHEKADHHYVRYYQKAVPLMEKKDNIKKEISEIIKKAERGNQKTLAEIRNIYEKVLD